MIVPALASSGQSFLTGCQRGYVCQEQCHGCSSIRFPTASWQGAREPQSLDQETVNDGYFGLSENVIAGH